MTRLAAHSHRAPCTRAHSTAPTDHARAVHHARPQLLIGVTIAALCGSPARAQVVPAAERSPHSFATADSLGPTTPVASVVLARPSRVSTGGSGLLELPSSSHDGTDERLAAGDDSVTSHQGRNVLMGLAIGTVAGAGLGYAAGKAWCDAHDVHAEGPPCEIGLPPLVALTAFAGLIVGGIIGGIIGAHAERELPGSPSRLITFDAIPLGTHGVALAVNLR